MKFGILFSGQGAQQTNMGLDFYQADPLFAQIFDHASELVGYDLVKVAKNENGELNQTKYVQPAIVAFSYALFQLLRRDLPELTVSGAVGLSLGEYSAIMAADLVSFDEGMPALRDRALYMQADADATPSAMAAVLKPDVATIEELCAKYTTADEVATIANYNSPKQVVLGGTTAAVKAVMADLKEAGGRVIPLNVSGAFHTPLFKNSSTKLATRLAELNVTPAAFPVMSNTIVAPFTPDNLAQTLSQQVIKPTHFADCLTKLIDQTDMDAVLELGPGSVLTKFAKQIDKSKQRFAIGDLAGYQAFVAQMKG